MAAIMPSTAFLPRTIHLGLPSMSRKAVEQQIEYLIGILDQIDGDPDEEEGDDDFCPCDLGEYVSVSEILPAYGRDQSAGPTNVAEVAEHYFSTGGGA